MKQIWKPINTISWFLCRDDKVTENFWKLHFLSQWPETGVAILFLYSFYCFMSIQELVERSRSTFSVFDDNWTFFFRWVKKDSNSIRDPCYMTTSQIHLLRCNEHRSQPLTTSSGAGSADSRRSNPVVLTDSKEAKEPHVISEDGFLTTFFYVQHYPSSLCTYSFLFSQIWSLF